MSYETYYDRYKVLTSTYKVHKGTYGLGNEWQLEDYDVVIERCGSGYACAKYRVLRNKPNLNSEDLAIICDSGNLCFGYRTEGSIICVYTD